MNVFQAIFDFIQRVHEYRRNPRIVNNPALLELALGQSDFVTASMPGQYRHQAYIRYRPNTSAAMSTVIITCNSFMVQSRGYTEYQGYTIQGCHFSREDEPRGHIGHICVETDDIEDLFLLRLVI